MPGGAERSCLPAAERSRAASTGRLEALQGADRTWYAGGWLRPPHVHEPAFCSGLDVAERILSGEHRAPRPHFVDFLHALPLMQGVDGCLITELDYLGDPVELAAGLWLVREGTVEIAGGAEQIGAGRMVGLAEAMSGAAPQSEARVIAAGDGWHIPQARLDVLRQDGRPEARALCRRLEAELARRAQGEQAA